MARVGGSATTIPWRPCRRSTSEAVGARGWACVAWSRRVRSLRCNPSWRWRWRADGRTKRALTRAPRMAATLLCIARMVTRPRRDATHRRGPCRCQHAPGVPYPPAARTVRRVAACSAVRRPVGKGHGHLALGRGAVEVQGVRGEAGEGLQVGPHGPHVPPHDGPGEGGRDAQRLGAGEGLPDERQIDRQRRRFVQPGAAAERHDGVEQRDLRPGGHDRRGVVGRLRAGRHAHGLGAHRRRQLGEDGHQRLVALQRPRWRPAGPPAPRPPGRTPRADGTTRRGCPPRGPGPARRPAPARWCGPAPAPRTGAAPPPPWRWRRRARSGRRSPRHRGPAWPPDRPARRVRPPGTGPAAPDRGWPPPRRASRRP